MSTEWTRLVNGTADLLEEIYYAELAGNDMTRKRLIAADLLETIAEIKEAKNPSKSRKEIPDHSVGTQEKTWKFIKGKPKIEKAKKNKPPSSEQEQGGYARTSAQKIADARRVEALGEAVALMDSGRSFGEAMDTIKEKYPDVEPESIFSEEGTALMEKATAPRKPKPEVAPGAEVPGVEEPVAVEPVSIEAALKMRAVRAQALINEEIDQDIEPHGFEELLEMDEGTFEAVEDMVSRGVFMKSAAALHQPADVVGGLRKTAGVGDGGSFFSPVGEAI